MAPGRAAEVQRLRALAGLGVGDELPVGDRLSADRLLQEAVEEEAPGMIVGDSGFG